jgi:hypothetical protein
VTKEYQCPHLVWHCKGYKIMLILKCSDVPVKYFSHDHSHIRILQNVIESVIDPKEGVCLDLYKKWINHKKKIKIGPKEP